ncbi:MAG: prephenate dehydratase domain-containing protein, partial [Acidimicrobiaceae bacterium]
MAKSQTKRVAYFGPAGTFTEQALLTQKDLAACELVAFRTVQDVLDAVATDVVDLVFVPIENSIEGTVNFTQDALVFDYDLLIQREIVLDIEHCLLARKGVSTGDLTGILSIPVATAQCHSYLRKNFGELDIRAANSTAEAAQLVAANTTERLAAIAPKNAGKVYGLEVIATDIA